MPEPTLNPGTASSPLQLTDQDWWPTAASVQERSEAGPVTLGGFPRAIAEAPTLSSGSPWDRPGWIEPVVQKLGELLQLPRNWSSYRSEPVRAEIATALLQLLLEVMADETPPPAVVPTASGGLQAEWHRGGYDLEIEAFSPYRFEAHIEELETGKVQSLQVISDLRPLVEWIALVSD